jgi:hypothetical protein
MEERGVSKLVGMKLTEERGSDGELKRPRPQQTVTQRHFPLEGAEEEPSVAQSVALTNSSWRELAVIPKGVRR